MDVKKLPLFPGTFACLFCVCFWGLFTGAEAQTLRYESNQIYQQLKKLNVLGNVMYIGVTPDDKNTQLLTWLSKEKQYHTSFISITRGENLKNEMGLEQGLELGLIRAEEAAAAERVDEIQHYFTHAYDFGYAATEEEVKQRWNLPVILEDLVWLIRIEQPDVVISHYNAADSTAGAKARVCARLIETAFQQAGDTAYFPNQLKYGVEVWHSNRLFTYSKTKATDALELVTDVYNKVQGRSVKDVAWQSRKLGKSIANTLPLADTQYVVRAAGDNTILSNLMEGVETTCARIDSSNHLQLVQLEDSILTGFDFLNPDASVPALAKLYKRMLQVPGGYYTPAGRWRQRKMEEIQQLILVCAGIKARAVSRQKYAVQGEGLPVSFFLRKNSVVPAVITGIKMAGYDSVFRRTLTANENLAVRTVAFVDKDKEVFQPYWIRKPMLQDENRYDGDELFAFTHTTTSPDFQCRFFLQCNGVTIFLNVPLEYSQEDAMLPMQYEEKPPVYVKTILPVLVSLMPENVLLNVTPGNDITANAGAWLRFKANFTADSAKTTIRLAQLGYNISASDGTKLGGTQTQEVYLKDTIMNMREGEQHAVKIALKDLRPVEKSNVTRMLGATVAVERAGAKAVYSSNLKAINYGYIPEVSYFYREIARIIPDEIKTKGRRIGFIYSQGDRAFYALEQMGFEVKELGVEDFAADSLKQYTAVITGIRLTGVQDYLEHRYDSVLAWVKQGGNLIVQGQDKAFALTYPFTLTTAPMHIRQEAGLVRMQLVESPAFSTPNAIKAADAGNWKQDICRYTAVNYDTAFHSLLTILQSREHKNANGCLLTAHYGNGNYIFTSLNLGTQLAAGVVSAYRLLANLVAMPAAGNRIPQGSRTVQQRNIK